MRVLKNSLVIESQKNIFFYLLIATVGGVSASLVYKNNIYSIFFLLPIVFIFLYHNFKRFPYILILLIIFNQFIYPTSFIVKDISIHLADIALSSLYIVFFIFLIKNTNGAKRLFFENKLIILFLIIFSIPILIGLMNGHRIQGIFNETRMIYYYSSIFLFIYIIKKEDIVKLLDFTVIISFVCLSYHLFSILMGINFESGMSFVPLKSGNYIRTYGIWSAWSFYIFSAIYLISGLLNNVDNIFSKRKLSYPLIFLFIYVSLITLVRTYFIGLIVSIFTALFLSRSKKKLNAILTLSILSLLVVFMVFVFNISLPNQINIMIERFGSIIMPSLSTSQALANYQYRINAIDIAKRKIGNNFILGKGYGEISLFDEKMEGISAQISHNSYVEIFVKSGLMGLFFTMFFYLYVLRLIFNVFRKTEDRIIKTVTMTSLCSILYILVVAFASGGNIFGCQLSPVIFFLGIAFALKKISKKSS